jgi:DNA-binding NarL/FixJ family response regulator
MISLLLIDDNLIYRRGLVASLAGEPDFEIVGQASQGDEALSLVSAHTPDVIISESRIAGQDGLELARRARLHSAQTAIIILADNDDDERLFQAIRVGAAAYCTRAIEPEELIDMIRRVARGEYLINDTVLTKPNVAIRVLERFRDLTIDGQAAETIFAPLSAREIEVLEHIAQGNSNKEIARQLKISDQTVKNHITSILRKLAVNDRTQAVVLALRQGWIKM